MHSSFAQLLLVNPNQGIDDVRAIPTLFEAASSARSPGKMLHPKTRQYLKKNENASTFRDSKPFSTCQNRGMMHAKVASAGLSSASMAVVAAGRSCTRCPITLHTWRGHGKILSACNPPSIPCAPLVSKANVFPHQRMVSQWTSEARCDRDVNATRGGIWIDNRIYRFHDHSAGLRK